MDGDAFVDLYEVLQVSPNANPETIHRVYRLLAQTFHPDNQETGNSDSFKQVTEAYRVLSDPERRAAYDVDHGKVRRLLWKIFDKPNSATGIEAEKRKRHGILALLYTKRMRQTDEPWLTIRQIEELLGCPRELLESCFWYLRTRQLVERSDNGRFVITADGVDLVEARGDGRLQEHRMLAAPSKSAPAEPAAAGPVLSRETWQAPAQMDL